MSLKGYATQNMINDVHSNQFATVEAIRLEQQGLSVVAHQFVREVGTDAAEAASALRDIKATAHAAQKGDIIRFTSGTSSGRESKVRSVATDNIYLVEDITPANGVTFQILRHKYPTVDAAGAINTNTTVTPAPIAYDLEGVTTLVHEDTTPADSRPLPVKVLDSVGVEIGFATQTTLAALLTELQLKADLSETQPVSVSGVSTAAKQDLLLAELQLKADLTETQPVSLAAVPLANDAAKESKQDTIIGHVDGIETSLTSLLAKDFSTQTTLAALLTELQLKADLSEKQPIALFDGSSNALTSELLGAKRGLHMKGLGYAIADSASKLSGTVTSGAWVELIASTAAESHWLQCFESSGYALELGVGAAASEVRQCFIPPGGTDYPIPLRIPAGSRVSVRAIATTADYTSPAQLLLTLLG